MKKFRFLVFLIIILLFVLLGCTPSISNIPSEKLSQSIESNTIALSTTKPIETAVVESNQKTIDKLFLNIPQPINGDMLISDNGSVFSVNINDDVISQDYSKNILTMPAYVWHINPEINENIESINIEFDLIDVCDKEYINGFERAYFIGLTDLEELVLSQAYDAYVVYNQEYTLPRPQLLMDLVKYAKLDGTKVKISIPYSHFIAASRDVVLQFIPGTTFENLKVYAQGCDVETTDIKTLTENIQYEYVNAVLPYINDYLLSYELHENDGYYCACITPDYFKPYGSNQNETYYSFYAEDGSYRMKMSELDIQGYEDQVDFEFGTAPEGLFYPMVMDFDEIKIDEMVHFVLDNMRDEKTGLISGIWDCDDKVKVANDRPSANSPLMLLFADYLNFEEISSMFYAILENEVNLINGKYYYLPNGVENNKALIKLIDLCDFSRQVYEEGNAVYIYGMSKFIEDLLRNNIIEYKDADIYTQAIANSLELVMKAQENNSTHLSSDAIYVTFFEDGNNVIENVTNEFKIDNYYYQTIINARLDRWHTNYAIADIYSMVNKRVSPDLDIVEENMHMLNTYRNCNAIKIYEHKIFRNIYDFIRIQDENSRLAPKYNLASGEPIFYDGSISSPWLDSYNRFGSPKEYINWMAIAGAFDDFEILYELEALLMDYLYETRDVGWYHYDNYQVADNLNIAINKDYICTKYVGSHIGDNVANFSDAPPSDAESLSWRESTGDRLKYLYTDMGVELTNEMIDIIEELSCESIY